MELSDQAYMKMALALAKKGMGRTNPNPMVGAVIVKNGKIIGQGYHHRFGGAHAERDAFVHCTEQPDGATLYVTLEPCCHYGKTPPCTDCIIEHRIRRVVVGIADHNPLVSGKGIALLRSHNIEVDVGVCQEECRCLNNVFFHFIQTKTPYVVMKYAMTADGKSAGGITPWITGEIARRRVHRDRNRYTAIMTGVGTVIADDPLLTCRIRGGRNPVRIICDTHLRTPLSSKIAATAKDVRTIIATASSDIALKETYRATGFEVLDVPLDKTHISLPLLMKQLGSMDIDSIFLEGGSTLNKTAIESGIVQKVQVYIAPKLYSDSSVNPIGSGIQCGSAEFLLTTPTVTRLGADILLEYGGFQCLPE